MYICSILPCATHTHTHVSPSDTPLYIHIYRHAATINHIMTAYISTYMDMLLLVVAVVTSLVPAPR